MNQVWAQESHYCGAGQSRAAAGPVGRVTAGMRISAELGRDTAGV